MVSENVAYGGPLVGLVLGAAILLYGLTLGHSDLLTIVGGLVGVGSVMALAWGAQALLDEDAHREHRDDETRHEDRGEESHHEGRVE